MWFGPPPYVGPLNKPILCLILAFGIPICVWQAIESVHVISNSEFPVKNGTIISKQKTSKFGVPRYKIRILVENTEFEVLAITNVAFAESCSDQVRFRFCGNPEVEVFLEGEEDPTHVAMIIGGACVLLSFLYLKFRGRKGWEGIID